MKILERIENLINNGNEIRVSFRDKKVLANGNEINISKLDIDIDEDLEELYHSYKHSRPTERSEKRRVCYFKALEEGELTDEDMIFGEDRQLAQARLEVAVLCKHLLGELEIENWFWQSSQDKCFVILKEWFEKEN